MKQIELVTSKSEFVVVVLHSKMEHLQELSNRVLEEVDRLSQAFPDRIKFFALSLDDHPDAVTQFGLTDVPSIIIYRDGYPRVYYGQRTGYTMFSFLQELLTIDPVKLLSHKNDKKQFSAGNAVKVIGYLSKDNIQQLEVYKQVAKHFQGEVQFGLVQDPKLAKNFKLKTDGEIAILKPGEKQIHSQVTFTSREELIDWIKQNQKPLWAELTFTNLYYVWQGSRITFVAFVKNIEEHLSKTILSTFKSLAKQYGPSQNIAFVVVDTNLYKDFSTGLGLDEQDIPTFALFDPFKRKEHFFPKDQYPLTLKHTKKWVEKFLSGKLEATTGELYSEEDAVVQLTIASFSETINDKEKDVLVEFYAPWCAHCSSFAPTYKRIATFMRLLPSTIVTAYDVQANLPPEKFNITSLPTMLFFPANNKDNAIPFGGPYDLNSLVEFILEHQTAADDKAVKEFKEIFTQLQQKMQDEDTEDDEDETIDLEEEDKEEL